MKSKSSKREKEAFKMPQTPPIVNPSKNSMEGNRKKNQSEKTANGGEQKLAPNEEL